jgi:hypothetical protein
MIWLLLLWFRSDGDVVVTPTELPVIRRDGAEFGALPIILRRST